MPAYSSPHEYALAQRQHFLDQLCEFLSIASISTLADHAVEVQRAAKWLATRMREAGLEHVEIVPTAGHPVVYADWLRAGPEAPTVLIYGHYDVQPPDPDDLWHSPPFDPTVRDGRLYARGASDDKGQSFIHIAAAEALLRSTGSLPVNVRFMYEGEEEVASANLAAFIEGNRHRLAAEVALISDTPMLGPDQPTIIYALRGLTYMQVTVRGPSRDLHSGHYGGSVDNPIHALATIVSRLHDEHGRVTIPGFYDRVRELSGDERAALAALPVDQRSWLTDVGVDYDWGETEYSILERIGARPSLDVNGILGGWTGAGSKTVLPAEASAKISMRLVPDQDPVEIGRLFSEHVRRLAPDTVSLDVQALHHAHPAVVERDLPAMRAAARACERVWGRAPMFSREGGTIPVVSMLRASMGMPTILMGFGLADDSLHSPNEKLDLSNFYRGIDTSIAFFEELGPHSAWSR